MPGSVISIELYRAESLPTLDLELIDFAALTARSIFDLTDTLGDGTRLGVAASYGKQCVLKSLAFSTETKTLVIFMDDSEVAMSKKALLGKELLCNTSLEKHGFFMERIAAALYLDMGLFIRNAFDVTPRGNRRGSKAAYKDVLEQAGIEYPLDESVIGKAYVEQRFNRSQQHLLAFRAWTCHVGVKRLPRTLGASIDTSVKDTEELEWMCKCVRDADRLASMKPSATKNDVSNINITKGAIDLQCTLFKTRIRHSPTQHVRFETDQGDMNGRVVQVQGRAVVVAAYAEFNPAAVIHSVITIGKEALTVAGMSRANLILDAFKGSDTLLSSPFVRMIFFPYYPLDTLEWPELPTTEPEINFSHIDLNAAQEEAMKMCLSNEEEDRHVVIVGPPGTGKTTVIAAVIHNKVAEDPSNTVWVIAQSNVAVKNVAEKLVESGFLDFKLLVSSDFHFDWHEHLYEEIIENMIESGDFKDSVNDTETKLEGARVILCTISLMSGKRIDQCKFTRIVPVQTVIVDEASQIEIGDYLPVLAKYKSTLRKMVFIGDDKQLPPYGTEDISELMSVFEWAHLRDNSIFLNIQYRMPRVIGSFISRHVYSAKLLTQHRIVTPTCCRFVDVRHGTEMKAGRSWTNSAEINCAVQAARRYLRERKKFKIITPYDAQRNAIENALKARGLAWENTVFNVDSFQGNEEDHIILSIVRTNSPGFLTNRRRTNVMLSRCKKSMLILTHRGFMQGAGALTLVGRFAEEHIRVTDWMTVEQLG